MTRKPETSTLMQSRRLGTRLASAELCVVGGVVLASIIDPRLLPAAVTTAAFFWPLRRLANGRWSVHTPADLAILALALMAILSLWITPWAQTTRPQVYRLLTGIAIYYTLANTCNNRQRLRLLLWVFSLGGLILAFFAPLSVDWPLGKLAFVPAGLYQRFSILVADSIHPNVIAGALVILLPLTLAWLLFDWQEMKGFERATVLLAAGSMSAILLLTLSRGAWVALLLAGLALIGLRWRWGWAAVAVSLLAAAAGIYWIGVERALDLLIASKTVGSMSGRLEVWSRAMEMILDFPFTGIGMGVFQALADRIYPFLTFGPGTVFHAHNLFLQVAVDLGLPGLLAWLWVLAVVIYSAGKVYRAGQAAKDPFIAALGAGVLCSQIALVVHGLTDAVAWGMVRSAPLVWVIWGTALAAALQARKPPTKSQAG